MIDSIIAAELRSAKRVVVPDLGSFIHKEGGQTVFAEFLKKDDGVLAAMLGREFGLSTTEAHEAIAEYAANVRRTVGANDRYVVAGVGVLHSDANGLLTLDAEPSISVAGGTAFSVAPEPALSVVAAPVIEPVVQPVAAPVIEPVVTPRVEPVVTQRVEPVVTQRVEPIAQPAAFEPEPLPTLDPQWERSTVYEAAAPAQPRPELHHEPAAQSASEPQYKPTIEPAAGALRDYIEQEPRHEPVREAHREPTMEPRHEPVHEVCREQQPQRANQEAAPDPATTKRAFTLNDLYGSPEESAPNSGYAAPSHTDYGAQQGGSPIEEYAKPTPSEHNSPTFADFGTSDDYSAPKSPTFDDYSAPNTPTFDDYSAPKPLNTPTFEEYSAPHREPAHHTPSANNRPNGAAMGGDGLDSVLRPPQIRRPEKLGARGSRGASGHGHDGGHPRKRRPDMVLIIAIVAAAAAICVMIWQLSINDMAVRKPIGTGADTTRVDSAAVVGGAPAAAPAPDASSVDALVEE